MSYLRAEDCLPREVLELVQQYVSGTSVYIPCKHKKKWGAGTNTRMILENRNRDIMRKYRDGIPVEDRMQPCETIRIFRRCGDRGKKREFINIWHLTACPVSGS